MTVPRSLGFRTDLFFPRFDGIVLERETYWVVRTPTNPTFHWGNFLLYKVPPTVGARDRWESDFRREFSVGEFPGHFAFGWDSPEGDRGAAATEFLDHGYDPENSVVLTAERVPAAARPTSDVTVRPLGSDADWDAALSQQIACRDLDYGIGPYTLFKTARMRRYRQMSEAGHGLWFGAFIGGELAASLGIYREEGVARFQCVGTRPEFQRRGICAKLVEASAQFAFREMGATTLVMVADETGAARRIYTSVGFAPTEFQVGVAWSK